MDLGEFFKVIEDASTNELQTCRRILDDRIRTSFRVSVGERVKFDAGGRGVITGRVTKVNAKSISVRADNTGGKWRVHPSLLTKI